MLNREDYRKYSFTEEELTTMIEAGNSILRGLPQEIEIRIRRGIESYARREPGFEEFPRRLAGSARRINESITKATWEKTKQRCQAYDKALLSRINRILMDNK